MNVGDIVVLFYDVDVDLHDLIQINTKKVHHDTLIKRFMESQWLTTCHFYSNFYLIVCEIFHHNDTLVNKF